MILLSVFDQVKPQHFIVHFIICHSLSVDEKYYLPKYIWMKLLFLSHGPFWYYLFLIFKLKFLLRSPTNGIMSFERSLDIILRVVVKKTEFILKS